MKISRIELNNFGIYKDTNELTFKDKPGKNISLIAGKNGFGKTTFLTSLIWCFYGKLMTQVEDKYRKDIKRIGGYNDYLLSLINKEAKKESDEALLSVEVKIEELSIPSMPCKSIRIKRSFDLKTKKEVLEILIDDEINELVTSVGFEVFINDFILPREIAKFFFFDAEKIVSLAEAKSVSELRNLSRAYSEVLGIKKYEDLRNNLESLEAKLRRRGVSEKERSKLNDLLSKEEDFEKEIESNGNRQDEIDKDLGYLKIERDVLQEKLIREGNSITLEELKELNTTHDALKEESKEILSKLKKFLDVAPLVISGDHLRVLHNQLLIEKEVLSGGVSDKMLRKELEDFASSILSLGSLTNINSKDKIKLKKDVKELLDSKFSSDRATAGEIYLEFNEKMLREFEAFYNNIKTTFLSQFKEVVKEKKINKALLNKAKSKIRQAEARKNNYLAKQYRKEKTDTDDKIDSLLGEKDGLLIEIGGLKIKLSSHKKERTEYEKNFKASKVDEKKHNITKSLLVKATELINRIKQDKKHSLQKSILFELKKLMHKKSFIFNVRITIEGDIMDIDLIDIYDVVIDKDSLSKGEQQLYATALLKALVDESGIKFPVFIDSPLQKFDKDHSENIIKEFYPTVSEQVVLFPLLEKELSKKEYELFQQNLNKVFLISNNEKGSNIKSIDKNNLFENFKENVLTH